MTITVIQPSFYINLKNPTEVKYQVEDNLDVSDSDWRIMTVQSWQFGCPAPKENEILYQYTDNRGCYLELSKITNEATAVKLPPILKNEPATPAKRSTPDEIKF